MLEKEDSLVLVQVTNDLFRMAKLKEEFDLINRLIQ
jgi:hypothetical protein